MTFVMCGKQTPIMKKIYILFHHELLLYCIHARCPHDALYQRGLCHLCQRSILEIIYIYITRASETKSPSTWLNPFKTGPGLEFKFQTCKFAPPSVPHPTPPSRWATASARPGRGLGKGGGRGHRARC